VTRLAERKVEVQYSCRVTRIVTGADGVRGVELADGSQVDADLVVAAVDPLAVFSTMLGRDGARAARLFGAAARARPPAVVHLGLRGANPPGLPGEVVLHGDPVITVETQGSAPAGHRAWTVRWRQGSGAAPADVLGLLARRGLPVDESELVCRIDTDPEAAAAGLGVAHPIVWDGLRAHRRRSSFARPLPGLYVLAAPLAPGATITEVAWTAAHVAVSIGKA
jgi:phytoene dehydrogenase-like protein